MPTVRRFRITVNGRVYEVEAEELGRDAVTVSVPATAPAVPLTPRAEAPATAGRLQSKPQPSAGARAVIEAPLPGLVLDVKVQPGQTVSAGQVLVILEAMKMENEIIAPDTGTVEAVRVQKGDSVSAGDVLVVLQ